MLNVIFVSSISYLCCKAASRQLVINEYSSFFFIQYIPATE